jgi:hypothetical protein
MEVDPTKRTVLHVGGTTGKQWRAGLAYLGYYEEQDIYVAVACSPAEAMELLRQAFEADHPGLWDAQGTSTA